ncbi:glycosyltransferase family 4 protein [Acetobacter garciniae]|uniref:glycosyltransferase family 4 protein n=1 Tax=Acetobacter garciniae TaxID=2817435 RepID=UPI001E4C90A8|nr:glycosyltransferase family 4 protein [Acetobacter garciniae]
MLIHNIVARAGTERSVCRVLSGLAERGHGADFEVLEVVRGGEPAFHLDGRIGRAALFDRPVSLALSGWRLMLRLRRHVRRGGFDTVVVIGSSLALFAVPALRGLGVRVVFWEHFNFTADLGKRKRRWGRQIVARQASDIVTLTERDIGLWRAGATVRARMTCIPNIAPPPASAPRVDMTARTVLAVGRLVPQKGFDLLLAAWARVCADPRADGWRLRIVGNGPEQAALMRQIETTGLSARVSAEPARSDIASCFDAAGLYCCSSRFEGLPMVLQEAISAGLPCVAFACLTGPEELIADGVSGTLVPPGDIQGLAEALIDLMADPARRQAYSRAALQKAAQFGPDRILPQWESLFYGAPLRR